MRDGWHLDRRPRTRWLSLIGGAAALPLLLAPTSGGAQEMGTGKDITKQVQQQAPIALPSLNPLVERVLPAVVNISAQLNEQAAETDQSGQSGDEGDDSDSPLNQFMRRFFENRGLPQMRREVNALGSGFIIDPSGYVVTNNHVVGNGNGTKITVIMQDDSRYPAMIIGRDSKTDLALLKINADKKLPFLSWGNSDQAKVGDWVVAVGNPFGLGGTVTAGIISAVGRNIDEGPYDDFLQIDAPINRGNSGGPTFNLSGEVIGINTAIYSPSGGSVGIGFAVPSETAKNVVQQLRDNGHVTRGWLGVSIQGITPAIARSLGLDPNKTSGALVAGVTPNSPAAKAGIEQGDVILEANGHKVASVHDLPRLVAATPPGQKLALAVRRNGNEKSLSATVAEMPNNPEVASAAESPEEATSLGLQLAPISPKLRSQYRIPKEADGVVVTNVAADSPAAELGVEAGDVIMSVDQQPVKTPQQAATELKQAAAKGNVLLLLNRQGTAQFLGMSVTPGVGSGHPG
jgi:serine protease Do